MQRCFAFRVLPAVCLAAAGTFGCAVPDYERWVPREGDVLEIFVSDGATEGFRGYTFARLRERLLAAGGTRLAGALAQRSAEFGGGVPEEPRDLEREFTRAAWTLGPDEVYGALRIRGERNGATEEESALVRRTNGAKLRAMYRDEFEEIDRAKSDPHAKRIGLALSGGGIRSASFATGVLQGLHELGLLPRVGYLSTVSGGGYAGGWYMLQDRPDEMFTPGSHHLQHLAQNGTYLTGNHFSQTSAIFLGKALLHTAFLPGHWLLNGLIDLDLNYPFFRGFYRDGLRRAFLYDEATLHAQENPPERGYPPLSAFAPRSRGRRPFWILNMHLALSDEVTANRRNRTGDAFELTPLRGGADAVGYVDVPSYMFRTPLATAAAIRSRVASLGPAPVSDQFLRRCQETIDWQEEQIRERIREIPFARILASLLERAGARSRASGKTEPGRDETLPSDIAKLLPERLREAGTRESAQDATTLAELVAHGLDLEGEIRDALLLISDDGRRVLEGEMDRELRGAARGSRMVRAVHELLENEVRRDRRLQAITGGTLRSLIGFADASYLFRCLTPACACARADPETTPERRWFRIVERNQDLLRHVFGEDLEIPAAASWMSPDRGVAISGAALDAKGLQKGFFLDWAELVFNWDLGYYIDGWSEGWRTDRPTRAAFHNLWFYVTSPIFVYKPLSWVESLVKSFVPGESWTLGARWHLVTQWAKNYRVTDGGHFENIGAYALVRRGCRLIVISDATMDPEIAAFANGNAAQRATLFADLREFAKKVLADFGAEVEFDWDEFGDLPGPRGALLRGRIRNLPAHQDGDGDPGEVTILVLKARYAPGEFGARAPFVDWEKSANPEFPQNSLLHQNYSERTVLAYRQLGRETVLANAAELCAAFKNVDGRACAGAAP